MGLRKKPKKKRKPRGFEVEVEHREDGVTRVALSGNSEAVDTARDEVEGVMQQLLSENRHKIVFDTLELDWFTVDVVGALIADTQRLMDAGGASIFVGLSDATGPLLSNLGILEFIGHTETLDEAFAWLHEAVKETSEIDSKRLQLTGEKDASGAVVISLRGCLGSREAKRLLKAVRGQVEKGQTKIVLDCSRLLDAAEVASFVSLVEEAKQAGTNVAFAALWGVPNTVVLTLGLDALLALHPDREAALAALATGSAPKKGTKKGRKRR